MLSERQKAEHAQCALPFPDHHALLSDFPPRILRCWTEPLLRASAANCLAPTKWSTYCRHPYYNCDNSDHITVDRKKHVAPPDLPGTVRPDPAVGNRQIGCDLTFALAVFNWAVLAGKDNGGALEGQEAVWRSESDRWGANTSRR